MIVITNEKDKGKKSGGLFKRRAFFIPSIIPVMGFKNNIFWYFWGIVSIL